MSGNLGGFRSSGPFAALLTFPGMDSQNATPGDDGWDS